MGVCYHKTVKQPQNYQSQPHDESFYLSEHKQNNNRYLFNMITFAESQLALKKISNSSAFLFQGKKILAEHMTEIQNLLAQLQDQKSLISNRIRYFLDKNIKRVIFFDLISIRMQKKTQQNIQMRISSPQKCYFNQKIDIKDHLWNTKGLFIEQHDHQNFSIQIRLNQMEVTISSTELCKYYFPVCQSSNIRINGSLHIAGQIYFKAQYINDIQEYKESIVNYLKSRAELIGKILNSNQQSAQKIGSLPIQDPLQRDFQPETYE